jgi:hypothetical protein
VLADLIAGTIRAGLALRSASALAFGDHTETTRAWHSAASTAATNRMVSGNRMAAQVSAFFPKRTSVEGPRAVLLSLHGVSESWDDAKLQQLIRSATKEPVQFLSYTVTIESGAELMVVSVPRSTRPFHTFARDVGNFRAGQYLIREGSSTRPIMPADLLELYLKPEHGYVSRVLKQYGVEARRLQALSNVMNSYQAEEAQLRRQMAASVGLSPRDLGWE